MNKPTIGFAMCGSFCTFEKAFGQLAVLLEEYDVLPVMSHILCTFPVLPTPAAMSMLSNEPNVVLLTIVATFH